MRGEVASLEKFRQERAAVDAAEKRRKYDEHHEDGKGLMIAGAVVAIYLLVALLFLGLGVIKVYELFSGTIVF